MQSDLAQSHQLLLCMLSAKQPKKSFRTNRKREYSWVVQEEKNQALEKGGKDLTRIMPSDVITAPKELQ